MKIKYLPSESYDISLERFVPLKPYSDVEKIRSDFKGYLLTVAKIILSFLPEGYTFDTSYFPEGVDCTLHFSGLLRPIFVKSPEGKHYEIGFRAAVESDRVYISVSPMFHLKYDKPPELEGEEYLPGELINAVYAPTTLYDLEYNFRLYERHLAGEISEADFIKKCKFAQEEE